ncbi:MAG: ABC transporter ATP-binding protein, partial [Pseudonocardiaceae bacterium]
GAGHGSTEDWGWWGNSMIDNGTVPGEQAASPDRRAVDRLLVRIVRRGGIWAGVLLSTSALLAAAQTVLPAALGGAVDAALHGSHVARWLLGCGVVIGVLLICEVTNDVAAGVSTARSSGWLRRTVLEHILALGTRTTRRFDVGDLTTRLVANAADAGRVGTLAIWAGTALVPALGGLVALMLIDPWLCLTFLVGTPVLLAVARIYLRDSSALADRYLQTQGEIAGRLVDALTGARTIAAAHSAEREKERILAPLPALHRHGMGMWRVRTRIAAQEALLVPLLRIAVLAVAGWELSRGRISPGQLLAASQYVMLAAGLNSAVLSISRLGPSRAAAARNASVLAEPAVPYGTGNLPAGPGRLEFRGVTVRAGEVSVLNGVDVVVPAGALVAVVGRSGSGKSMLATLAGRLRDPDEGQVLLDGVALPQLTRRELRRGVCCAFERPMLIGQTLADVIAFGHPTPGPPELVTAARAARADTFIRRMPTGYQTPLAQAPMSGGEIQRMGLARAFAHPGRVLVLDDVAASLDTVTEHHIRGVLTGALADRTRLVVSHRVSTAARADLVIWLDNGTVRAVAPHHQLWSESCYQAVFDPAFSPPNGMHPGAPA